MIFKTFETPIWNGKQNNLTGPVIIGSFEKSAPGPSKMKFRYHSGVVMLTYIFESYNYYSLIFCMIAVLNEQLDTI